MTLVLPERAATPAPVAATVRQGVGALSLSAMSPAEVWGFCERLANTPLLPDQYRKQPSSVLWAMEYGRALGLDVVTTINTIHVIKGKPTQSADLMLSRARGAGHRVRIQQGDGECTVSIWRHDDAEFENRVRFSVHDAVTALLCELRDGRTWSRDQNGKPTSWEKWPRNMLRARAIAECVRQACPEVLHGAIYTPEELGAVIDQEGNPVLDVQPTFQRQAPGQDQWEQAAPAAPVQQQTAEPAFDAAAEGDLGGGRDWINEATEAVTADETVQVWHAAKAAGAHAATLNEIVAIGKEKRAAEQRAAESQQQPAGPLTPEQDARIARVAAQYTQPEPDTLPGAPDDRRSIGLATADMLTAGAARGVSAPEVWQMVVRRFGHGADGATVAELRAIEAEICEVAL